MLTEVSIDNYFCRIRIASDISEVGLITQVGGRVEDGFSDPFTVVLDPAGAIRYFAQYSPSIGSYLK